MQGLLVLLALFAQDFVAKKFVENCLAYPATLQVADQCSGMRISSKVCTSLFQSKTVHTEIMELSSGLRLRLRNTYLFLPRLRKGFCNFGDVPTCMTAIDFTQVQGPRWILIGESSMTLS